MAKQTFLSYKYFKDSAGVSYVILTSHPSDLIASVTVDKDSNISILSEARDVQRDGILDVILKYKGSGTLNVVFESSAQTSIAVNEPSLEDRLPQDFASLRRIVTFDVNLESEVGYSISDSIYYSEGAQYSDLFIFPSSTNKHLDASSNEDYYYTADGSAAYMASTDLQNDFLNRIGHTNLGSTSKDIGKPRGEKDNNSILNFVTRNSITEGVQSPKVYGAVVILSLFKRANEITNVACLDPRASNYYLSQCRNEELPCLQDGPPVSDCNGNALNDTRINSRPTVDGGCCTYTTGCNDYEVVLQSTTKSESATLATGTATFVVTGGTPNFSASIEVNPLIGLEDSSVTYAANTQSGFTSSEITIETLYPGGYTIKIKDSTSPDFCTQELAFTIGNKGELAKGLYGCKALSSFSAINYDVTVNTHADEACVFCNTGGYLRAGSKGEGGVNLGPWVLDSGNTTTVRATSTPSGASNSNGKLNFSGIKYPEAYTVLANPNLLEFSVSEEFVTNQSTPIGLTAYRMLDNNLGVQQVLEAQQMQVLNQDAKSFIIDSNISAIASPGTASTSGGAYIFANLSAGVHFIIAQWSSDGNYDGSPEEEKCYAILGPYVVQQSGCTDSLATNFNKDANFEDGSCVYPENIKGCTDPSATNFNPSALVDDGSCAYPENLNVDVYGCTDPSADNYDIRATIDNGSCIYPSQGSYKCVKSVCTFVENDFTGSKTLQECVDRGCTGVETDETRLRDFSATGFTITSTNSDSTE